jgi:hypothetical protein
MVDTFTLPTKFNGEEKNIHSISCAGYTTKIQVTIDRTIVTFEPDEEQNFRAIIPSETAAVISPALLKEIR